MKKKFYYIVLTVLVISIFYNFIFYLSDRINKVKSEKILKILENTNNQILSLSNGLELLKDKYNNNDIVGYLEIENEDFLEPLLQTNDNSYYLNHLINKSNSELGSTFIDSSVNELSKQISIYSHSSTIYDLPFNILNKYLDQEYFNNHKILKLNYLNKIELYEVFSVYITASLNHLNLEPVNWDEHVKNMIESSIYKSDIDIKNIDKMIVLQTCYNGNSDGIYLIICGRKIG